MGKKKTQEEFLQEMEVKHPELEVMGEYTGNHNKVLLSVKYAEQNFLLFLATWFPKNLAVVLIVQQ